MSDLVEITLTVNEKTWTGNVHGDERLLDTLRDRLGLKGTKEGCGGGECGACTVIMNGKAVPSCIVLSVQADGSEITTIEGLKNGEKLHPIQRAFADAGAVQCGYCTPGLVLTTKALLDDNPDPTEQDIRLAISGNLCRCTGYTKIIEAVKLAAKRGGEE